MSELNKDGLEIGKPVDFETMMRVNRERRQKPVERVSGGVSGGVKRGRKSKRADN